MTIKELLNRVDELPTSEKWQLVNHVMQSLQQETQPTRPDWHTFLRETFGSLRDTPIQRWEQGEYEEREPIE